MPGPTLRTDIVEVYLFRRTGPRVGDVQFLQLRRATPPLPGSWQPVMGHVEPGETAVAAALREVHEETGYAPAPAAAPTPDAGRGLLHLWQLETPNAYFLATLDAIMLGPCFAAEVDATQPTLDPSHDAFRWVPRDHADRAFLWPGQRHALGQIIRDVLPPDSPVAPILRIEHPPI